MNTDNFRVFLEGKGNLKDYSKGRYLAVPRLVDDFLNNLNYDYDRILDITSIDIINEIMSLPEFIDKNNREGHIFSASLNHYKDLLKAQNVQENIVDQEFVQDVEEELSKRRMIRKRIKDEQEPVPPVLTGARNQHKRDNVKSAQAIVQVDFKCEVDNSHQYFISKKTGENYCEAHHFIPMAVQCKYKVSLDVYANLVSLCPVCHRILHHGKVEDKKEILERIYNNRITRLNACGIFVTLDELIKMYR